VYEAQQLLTKQTSRLVSVLTKSNDVAPKAASDDDDTLSYFSKLAEEE